MTSFLNEELNAALDGLLRARGRLTSLEFIAYVAIVLERYTKESARISFGEALRASREQS
jgi:hypothetical protein